MKTIEELEAQLTAISEQIKELKNKPKFEVGKWYNLNGENFMKYLVDHLSENNNMGYGLNRHGEWSNNDFGLSGCVPATPEEVKAALVKEAEKRGYVMRGVKFVSAYSKCKCEVSNCIFTLDENNTRLLIDGNAVFYKGQWAIIIKDDVIKVGSYEVKFHKAGSSGYDGSKSIVNHTSIDSNCFTKEFWKAAKLISEHSKAKIMVGCSKQFDVSLETINKILDKL